MNKFSKYPSIEQFRHVVKSVEHIFRREYDASTGEWVYNKSKILPTLLFTGTTKVHGTNAGIYVDKDRNISPQKKSEAISIEKDNFGFAAWLNKKSSVDGVSRIRQHLEETYPDLTDREYVIYGEWCGGNIQKGIAISGLEKMFIIFGVKVIGDSEDFNFWLDLDDTLLEEPSANIYDVRLFGTWAMQIDFENPQLSVNRLKDITESVEKVCPVGEYFGASENTIGEGVVWSTRLEDGTVLRFKVKGEKHSVSKVKTLANVDVEKLNSINDFVEYAVTESRLNQAANEVLFDHDENKIVFDRKKLGAFIKWVSSDVIKEESDTLSENDLSMRDVGSKLSKVAKNWFFEKELI